MWIPPLLKWDSITAQSLISTSHIKPFPIPETYTLVFGAMWVVGLKPVFSALCKSLPACCQWQMYLQSIGGNCPHKSLPACCEWQIYLQSIRGNRPHKVSNCFVCPRKNWCCPIKFLWLQRRHCCFPRHHFWSRKPFFILGNLCPFLSLSLYVFAIWVRVEL